MAMTAMVDLTRDSQGNTRARLLDLVPGRSGPVYARWLNRRGPEFKAGIKIATLDPFRGYQNAIDDQLEDATAVLDAFHITKLAITAMDEVRRRVQQQTLARRGRKGDPLYRIARVLKAGAEKLTPRQEHRLDQGLKAGDPNAEVATAWQIYQKVRVLFHYQSLTEAKARAVALLASLPSCPIPEIARLGRTLTRWKPQFLAYFDTQGASNGGTEAINNVIELHRRIARGYRNPHNYRLRMILAAGHPTHTQRR